MIGLALCGVSTAQAAPDTRAVLFIVDSLPGEYLETLVHQGVVPNIREHIYDRGASVKNCVTTFPSTSFAVHAGVMTGTLTNRHNISGLRWFDRSIGQHRSYAGPDGLNLNPDIPSDLRIFYELLPGENTVAVGVPVYRGAAQNFPGLLPSDEMRMGKLKSYFQTDPAPRFAAAWLVSLDMASHRFGPFMNDSLKRIQEFDRYLGDFVDLLKKRGLYDSTYLCLTADHGQMQVTDSYSWRGELTRMGFDPYDNLMFNLKPQISRNYDLVFWSFALAAAQMWLVQGGIPERSTGQPLNWAPRPSLDEIRNYEFKGRRIDFVDLFTRHESIDWVLCRGDEPDTVHVFGAEGEGIIAARFEDGPSLTRASFEYRIVKGEDPLGLDAYADARRLTDAGFISAEEWFAATASTDVPDAMVQLTQIMFSERTGDIFLNARDHWELHNSWHLGQHGGFARDEMIVPFVIAGPGIEQQSIDRARIIDIYPTLARCLDVEYDPAAIDAQPLDLTNEYVSRDPATGQTHN